jgi:7-carboxy-7-deazaguanine synthase
MILVRLQGCQVGCSWCDTPEAQALNGGEERDALDLLFTIKSMTEGERWCLLTGGEPLEQDVVPLVKELREMSYRIALETSGVYPIEPGVFDWVCLSPKPWMPPLFHSWQRANEIKLIVTGRESLEFLDDELRDKWLFLRSDCEICLQPVSQQPRATQLCIEEVRKRGWRLSIQTHRYLGLK